MPRRAARKTHRPDVESLEIRSLLSVSAGPRPTAPGPVRPAGDPGGDAGTYFDSLIGASAARAAYKVDGSGLTVAVIDTGVNYNHEALGGGFGAGKKVVAGWDFAGNDADPMPVNADHGTAVAGLIASDDPAHLGVAPGADVAALRIFDDSGQGDFNRVADALQWVVDHHDQYHISAVNISLSDGRNYTQNWFAHDGGVGQRITGLVSKLDGLNIPVITATGNSFDGSNQGSGFTGIIADSISVTSTDSSDNLVSNAQRLGASVGGASATDLAAPGASLDAPTGGSNGFGAVTGTSFSAPLVTGAVVLLQQAYMSRFGTLPTVDQIDGWLKQGADTIKDSVTGLSIGRLDIPKALSLLPTPAEQVLTPPVAAPAPTPVVVAPTPTPVTPAPAPVTPAPTTPPASTTTTDWSGSNGDNVTVWVNGRAVTISGATAASFSNLPAFLQKAIASLKGWWTGSSSRVKVWAGAPGGTQTAGVVKKLGPAAATRAAASATPAGAMPRAWHTFVARSRTR